MARNILAVVAGLIAGIINMVMIPHPVWFWILGIIVFLPSAYAGYRVAPARKAA